MVIEVKSWKPANDVNRPAGSGTPERLATIGCA
jgi:hypothetical protein